MGNRIVIADSVMLAAKRVLLTYLETADGRTPIVSDEWSEIVTTDPALFGNWVNAQQSRIDAARVKDRKSARILDDLLSDLGDQFARTSGKQKAIQESLTAQLRIADTRGDTSWPENPSARDVPVSFASMAGVGDADYRPASIVGWGELTIQESVSGKRTIEPGAEIPSWTFESMGECRFNLDIIQGDGNPVSVGLVAPDARTAEIAIRYLTSDESARILNAYAVVQNKRALQHGIALKDRAAKRLYQSVRKMVASGNAALSKVRALSAVS